MPTFRARYTGRCAKCSQPVNPGDYIAWSKKQRGVIYHATCINPQDTQTPQPFTPQGPQQDGETPTPQTPQGPHTHPEYVTRPQAQEIADERHAHHLKGVLDKVQVMLDSERPRTLIIKTRDKDNVERKTEVQNAHHMLERMVYLIGKRRHVYLYGPPGSGKSTGAVQGAKILGMEYGYISLNPQTPESRLLGYMDAGGTYRATEFFHRYTQGGVMCIDELDNGHPALLNTLNGGLETDADGIGRMAFPCGVVERHPNFICIATGNTNGRGGDKLFPERRALDAAFMERFAFLAWNYDLAMEKTVTLAINANAKPWLDWVRKVRGFCTDHALRMWASPRASFVGADLLKDSGWDAKFIADTVLFKGIDPDTRQRILDACPLPTFEVTATEAA